MKFSDFVIVGSNSLQLITFYHFPMQKLLYYSLFSDYQVYNCYCYGFEQQMSNKNVKRRAF